MGCGCNQNGIEDILAARRLVQGEEVAADLAAELGDGMARMAYIGDKQGAVPFGGLGRTPSGAVYWGANTLSQKYAEVPGEDVQWLLNTGQWEVVATRQPVDLQVPPTKVKLPTAKRKPGTDVDLAPADAA